MNATTFATNAELSAMVTPDKLGIVGQMSPPRIGVNAFSVFLEFRHFTPRDPALNAKYEYALVKAPDGIVFFLILVPQSYRPVVDALLVELKLRLADGVPHILGNGKAWHFPVVKPNVFTLENLEGSFVYFNNPELFRQALAVEKDKIDEVFKNYDQGL